MVKRVVPGPGQESVWDYPRPPRVEPVPELIRVVFGGIEIAKTSSGYRVLETSHPPTYYIPQHDILMQYLSESRQRTFCEFKGVAVYWNVEVNGRRSENAAWMYPQPSKGYETIKDHLAFYASRVDACFVGDEQVQPQEGDFYGGWITSRVVGPFKGSPGIWG